MAAGNLTRFRHIKPPCIFCNHPNTLIGYRLFYTYRYPLYNIINKIILTPSRTTQLRLPGSRHLQPEIFPENRPNSQQIHSTPSPTRYLRNSSKIPPVFGKPGAMGTEIRDWRSDNARIPEDFRGPNESLARFDFVYATATDRRHLLSSHAIGARWRRSIVERELVYD